MIKRLYLANGNLTQPLDKNDENIAVDANTATQLSTLNTGDWCYLTLIEGNKLEVIKITKFPSWYWVDRGQDNTSQFSFSTQARIIYLLTAQEIEDAVNGTPLNIYPNGYGALEVSTGVNSWQISYNELNISTLGGISWMNPDGYSGIIVDNSGMFGCCDGNLTGAPYAGGIFFYLTSQLYAYEDIEYNNILANGANAQRQPIIPGSSWWLLTQPTIIDEYAYTQNQLADIELFGGAAQFSTAEYYINTTETLFDMDLYGGAKSYVLAADKYINMDSYLLEMLTFGNAVVYNKYMDQYINTSITNFNLGLS